MVNDRAKWGCWVGLVLATQLLGGCVVPGNKDSPRPTDPTAGNPDVIQSPSEAGGAALEPGRGADETAHAPPWSEAPDRADPLAGPAELSLPWLVAEVQARNPSLQAVAAAWRAAAARYPQMISLDDPMFGWMLGPAGMADGGGWMVMASQKFPWPCKRRLKGQIAAAEAEAASREVQDVRLQLAEAAAMALLDYYLVQRQLEINASTSELMRESREVAKTKYAANQVPQQDVLQAELELADLEGRRAELTREEKVAVARLNTLLHRTVDHPLPPAPKRLEAIEELPAAEALRELALQQRPDLAAEAARIRSEQAALALACKEFYPDFELVGKYDAFMPHEMRPQVGINLNVPLRRARRSAAVQEAEARLQQRRAEYQVRLDQVHFEVQSAYARLSEGGEIVRLYREKIIPAAEQNADSARANYSAGKVDFLRLIEAQRQLYREQEKHYQAAAEYHRRLAELQRVIGQPLPPLD